MPGLDPLEWTPRELRHSFVSVLSEVGVPVEQISQLVGHSGTTGAHTQRHGVELRREGLTREDIPVAASLYGQGWSLTKLGVKFGVDSTTVWRALRAAGVAMLPSSHRR